MSIEFEEFAQQGWQCPICKLVYSPFTPMCWYCGNDKQTTVTSTGTDINPGYMPPIKEEKLDLANMIRKKIELAGQRGQKEQYHVDGEYGDHGWMHYTKGIRDACWAVDEVIAELKEKHGGNGEA